MKEAFGGNGAAVVIESVGNARALPEMLECLAEGGKLFLFGIPGDLRYPADLFQGPMSYTVIRKTAEEWQAQAHEQVLAYYRQGQIQPRDFCNGELPFQKIRDGFAAIRRKEAMKLTITL